MNILVKYIVYVSSYEIIFKYGDYNKRQSIYFFDIYKNIHMIYFIMMYDDKKKTNTENSENQNQV